MDTLALVYLTLYLLSAIICLFVGVYTWQRQTVKGTGEYSLLAFTQGLLVLFFIIELLSPSKQAKIFWDTLQWICMSLLPVILLWFVTKYTQANWQRPRLFWIAVLAFPSLFILLILTNPLHGLVMEASWIRSQYPFWELVYDLTPLDEFFFGYAYLVASLAIGMLGLKMRRLSYPGNYQVLLIILAAAVPYIVGIGIILGARLGPFRDATPFAYAISNSIALVGLYRMRLFDISPVARDVLIENLPDEVVVIDSREQLVYLNLAAARRFEVPLDGLIGRSMDDLYQAWPALLLHMKDPAETEAFRVQTSQGDTRAYQLRTTWLRDRLGISTGRVILINDVTHLKATEAELVQHRQYLSSLVDERTAELQKALDDLQASKDELEQRVADRTAELAAQNRELETFAYSISHDLKAPLRGIDGYSRLLQESQAGRLDGEGLIFLDNILRATSQMYQLIEDLLEYSRFQRRSFSRQKMDLCRLVNSVLSEFEEQIEKRDIEVINHLDCQELFIEVDGLSQALHNLVDNSIKFTRGVPKPRIEIGTAAQEDGCLFWVRDNGIGFDMIYHDRIFEIFQRLHRSEEYSGTGMGLAMVHKAVQRMGGRVWAESAPGCGATFYLKLPVQEAVAPMVQLAD
jgi:PAS domain S-box-containing protein